MGTQVEPIPGEDEFLPQLARLVAEWFPELDGRAIAVTEIDKITPDNRPTLPIAILAFNRELSEHPYKGNRSPILTDDFVIEFWFAVKKYAKKDKSQSPFWQYFPVEAYRTKLLGYILRESKRHDDWGIQYISMDLTTDPQAVMLTFRFNRNYMWCEPVTPDDEEQPFILTAGICGPGSSCEED